MKRVRLDHIGIAVADLSAITKLLRLLGLEIDHSESNEHQRVLTHFVPLSSAIKEQPAIELLESSDPSGIIAQFVEKSGPGIHHLSFSVEKGQLDALCLELKAQGYRLIYDAPRHGARQMQINFIHPDSAGGVLVELMEPS